MKELYVPLFSTLFVCVALLCLFLGLALYDVDQNKPTGHKICITLDKMTTCLITYNPVSYTHVEK